MVHDTTLCELSSLILTYSPFDEILWVRLPSSPYDMFSLKYFLSLRLRQDGGTHILANHGPGHRACFKILLKCAPWLSLSVSIGMKSHVDQPKFVVLAGTKSPEGVDSDVSYAPMASPFTDISIPPNFTVVVVWDIEEEVEWPSAGFVVDFGSKR